jgi:flagellar biosynthesis GTPase FlhF
VVKIIINKRDFKMATDGYEKVCEILEDVGKKQQELTKELAELTKSKKEIDEQLKKTDEQLKKTDEQVQKTHLELSNFIRAQEEAHKKVEFELSEFVKSQEETHKKVEYELSEFIKAQKEIKYELSEFVKVQKETNRRFDDSVGRFAEGLVTPCIEQTFKEMGIEVIDTSPRRKRHKAGDTLEIDVFCLGNVINGAKIGLNKKDKVVILTSVKSFLHARDITEFVEKTIPNFRYFWTDYEDYKIIGVVAGITIEDGAKKYGKNKGLYVFVPAGDTLKLFNPPEFKPKLW